MDLSTPIPAGNLQPSDSGWNDHGHHVHLPFLTVTGPLPLSEQQTFKTASPSRSSVRK